MANINMKEKLNQATEGLKQVKSKMEPYFNKAKPFLYKAKELTMVGIQTAAKKANQLKNDYLQKKANENNENKKENQLNTGSRPSSSRPETKKETQQPPNNI